MAQVNPILGSTIPAFRNHPSHSRSPVPQHREQTPCRSSIPSPTVPTTLGSGSDVTDSLFGGGFNFTNTTNYQSAQAASSISLKNIAPHTCQTTELSHDNDRHLCVEDNVNYGRSSSEAGAQLLPQGSASPSHNSFNLDDGPSCLQPKYILRSAVRQGNNANVASTWLDQDESGTYDPSQDGKKAQSSLQKKRKLYTVASRESDMKNSPVKRTKPCSWEMARRKGRDFVITLKLKSDKGTEWLRRNKEDMENWPEGSYNKLIEPQLDVTVSSGIRRCLRSNKFQPTSNETLVIADPAEEHDDLFGHPAARGCVSCRKSKLQCSLARDEGDKVWPCIDCHSAGIDCELLIPPRVKQVCLSCKRNDFQCSYLDTEMNFGQPCDECLASGQMCIAGPYPGSFPQRISLKRWAETGELPPPHDLVGPGRKYTACAACRQEKKSCSLKSKFDLPPCKLCSSRKIACTFDDIIKTNRGKQPIQVDINQYDEKEANDLFVEDDSENKAIGDDVVSSNRCFSPSIDPRSQDQTQYAYYMTDAQGHFGPVIALRTSFSHPIQFNYVPLADAEKDPPADIACHFCLNSAFGVIGWGELKSTQVIQWASGTGYTELLFGYISEGCPPTRMCAFCTQSRMRIITCGRHVMEPMLYAVALQSKAFRDGVERRLWDGVPEKNEMWCTVCMRPASHRCARDVMQTAKASYEGKGISETVDGGCGLVLCSTCVALLEIKFGGDFETFVRCMEGVFLLKGSKKPLNVRADIGFLRKDGLLMRYLK